MPITAETLLHDHVFLGESHDASARKTWTVIWICSAMMVLEIVGGLFFGSIALAAHEHARRGSGTRSARL